jgi:hypothetical protein
MTTPRLRDGPKGRRGKPPLYLPASARMGRAVRGKRSTTPSRGKPSTPHVPGGAEDPPLAPVPFAQSYRFVCSLIAPPRPSRARPCSECGSCPCPRRSIWGWDPKEAQHLGGGGLPTLSAASRNPSFAKVVFREGRLLRPSLPSPEENAAPLAKTPSGSPGPPRSPGRACVGVLARDLPAHREAVVWRGAPGPQAEVGGGVGLEPDHPHPPLVGRQVGVRGPKLLRPRLQGGGQDEGVHQRQGQAVGAVHWGKGPQSGGPSAPRCSSPATPPGTRRGWRQREARRPPARWRPSGRGGGAPPGRGPTPPPPLPPPPGPATGPRPSRPPGGGARRSPCQGRSSSRLPSSRASRALGSTGAFPARSSTLRPRARLRLSRR